MQPLIRTTLIFILAMAGQADDKVPQPAAESGQAKQLQQMAAVVRELQSEVLRLRRIIAQYEFDRHREMAGKLDAELATVRSEQAMIEELERGRQQDIEEIDRVSEEPDGDSAKRADLASTRSELATQRAQEIAQMKDAARLRESELTRRLQAEEQTLRNIEQMLTLTEAETK